MFVSEIRLVHIMYLIVYECILVYVRSLKLQLSIRIFTFIIIFKDVPLLTNNIFTLSKIEADELIFFFSY